MKFDSLQGDHQVKYFFRFVYRLLPAFLFLSLISPSEVNATHASGSDLQYRWISGNTFEVTVSFYRDCAGVAAPNSITLSARSVSCGQTQNYTLNKVSGTGQEITFPCTSVQTKCSSGSSSYPGYQQYLYRNNITLPAKCSDWVMNYWVCCRNCAITTLNDPCDDNMYIEATLNNLVAGTNSSPRFTNIPVAFLCVNQNFTYNHGVIDPDGDSLVYSFITPKTYNSGNGSVGNVTFNPGYSSSSPLTSSPATAINSVTGDITMHPTVNGEVGVTAILVREYRNGVLIGSVIRDMQFLTKVCNPNLLPTASGMNGTSDFEVTVCPGTPVSFTVNSADPNPGDTVTMTWNAVIPGATFNTTSALLPVGTFSWTPSLSDARTQPYTFIVVVRDNACPTNGSQTYSYTVKVPLINASVTSPTFLGYNVACEGASTGSATVVPSGGTLPYTYSWNPGGQTTITATNLSAGAYTVTVTDADGCTKTASTTLTEAPAFSTVAGSFQDVSCNGGNDGVATVSASGGMPGYTWSWSPGGFTDSTVSTLQAVSYTVTVTDQNGCTSQEVFSISEPTAVSGSVSSFSNVSCQGNANGTITASASGGTPPYTHRWSTGDTTETVVNLAPGTYRDTIRDANNCQFILTQAITEPGSAVGIPSSSLSTTNVSCNGVADGTAMVVPSGGTGPYTVTWSNGDSGNSADSLAAGSYMVTIVDDNGCTFDSTINITEPAILTGSLGNFTTTPGGTNIACNGDATGGVKIAVSGGTPPYSYAWSNGASIDSIAGVVAGSYIITITDDNGCIFKDTAEITEPAVFTDSLIVQHVGCKGESSGWIRAVAYGGSPAFSYSWNPFVSSTDSAGSLPAGFYEVTITDLNGCVTIDTVTITEPDTLVPLILPSTYIGAVNLKCNGDNSGSATVNVFGGTPPFTYQWSVAGTDSFVTGLSAGIISVFVRDANGCSIWRDTTLIEPDAFMYAPSLNDPFCYGDSSGYITLNAGGSTPPFNILWNNGETTDSIGNLSSGLFYAIITDANSCEDSLSFFLSEPDSISSPVSTSDYQGFEVSCNGGSDGYIVLQTSGGTGPYTYAWSTTATADSIGGLTAGSYDVSIFDYYGCQKDTTIVLDEPTLIIPVLTPTLYSGGVNVSCFGYNDATIYSSVSGGVPPYTYSWSNGDVADSAVGITAGLHTLTVTDSNGCVMPESITITEPTAVTLLSTISDFNGYSVPCFGDTTACISVTVSGGNMPYTYVWDIQDTMSNPMVCNMNADTVTLSVFDANGCQLDTSFILTEPQPFSFVSVLSDYSGFEVQCNGTTNGSVDLTVNGGVAPFSYAWSNGDTLEDVSGLGAGIYDVIVTDANGCVDSTSFQLNEPPAISDSITSVSASCGQNNGVATVTVTSGLPPFTYAWTPSGQSTATATSLPAGVHTVVVTDSVGCQHTDSISVTAIQNISVTIPAQTNNDCFGGSTGTATLAVSGGTAPFSYLWSNGDTGMTADSLAAGNISVQVTDSNNCVTNASATITEPSQFSPSFTPVSAMCSGVNNGSVSVSMSGGTAPYTFTWSNGDSGPSADSLGGGYVVLNVTDDNGCTYSDSVMIQQPTALSSSVVSFSDVICNGSMTGSASVAVATGGTGPYTYNWSNGDAGLTADSMAAGSYTVLIADANNCTVSLNVIISEPPVFSAQPSTTPVSCYGSSDGQASVSASGGTPGYTYSWSTGDTTTSVSSLLPGTYSVTVTDANNCNVTASIVITEPAQLVTEAGEDASGCDLEWILDAELLPGLTGSWTSAVSSIVFSSQQSPTATVSGITEGANLLYWTVSDGLCFGTDSVTITLSPLAECDLELPSGFSPNGDGYNDGYYIRGIERYPENTFIVFNRWGNEVYRKDDYKNSDWTGQNSNGDEVAEGTYYVILEINGGEIRRNTYVDLRRSGAGR